jgi:hypothetical protein
MILGLDSDFVVVAGVCWPLQLVEAYTACLAATLDAPTTVADKCDKRDGMRPFGGDRQWDVCGKFVQPL